MADELSGNGIPAGLEQEIMLELVEELQSLDPNLNASVLLIKIRNAMRDVKKARKYPSYYTDGQIEQDMYNYYSNIRNIALYDYNLIGNEGQTSSSENNISRSYIDRDSLFNGIIPLSRF